MESNQAALAVVDATFSDLERKVAGLDQLTDKLQTSRERIAELDGEIVQGPTLASRSANSAHLLAVNGRFRQARAGSR